MTLEKIISVVTCTFNRAYLLDNLYNSLKKQTFKNFVWIVIDDGSTDNTEELIERFIDQKIIDIVYKKIENGGKHRALNKAIQMCETKLFFIVDSDDQLVNNSLERIIKIENGIKDKDNFCGLAGMRASFNGKLLSNIMKSDVIDATALESIYRYNLKGDKAEVFYSKVLKKYRFPEFEGEKFLNEAVLWNKIANDGYKIRWFNEVIYLGNYQNDGLTKHMLSLSIQNYRGRCYYHNEEIKYKIPLLKKIYHQSNYFRYGLCGKEKIKNLFEQASNKLLCIITLPIGYMGMVYTKLILKYRHSKENLL